MGLSLDARMVELHLSFRELRYKPVSVPDRPAQDIVDKLLDGAAPRTGVMVVQRTHDVDCSGLIRILENQHLCPQRWWHRLKLDDKNPTQRYHSITIQLGQGVPADMRFRRHIFDWLHWYLQTQAFKVRGYENPFYEEDKETPDKLSSLNLDPLDYHCPRERAKFMLIWSRSEGLRVMRRVRA